MKKLFVSLISIMSSTIIFGQDVHQAVTSGPSFESLLPLFAISLLVILVIRIVKIILENKLRNKIIDRGISEQLASSILGNSLVDKKDESIKWAFLLLGLSAGLTVTYHTTPLDIHSLAIMVFSLGLSYLVHYFYLRKNNK